MELRVSSPTFVGRQAELARVSAALDQARAGMPAFFLVAGEAGVGKTRFVEEIAGRARSSGMRVLEGGCVQLGEEGLPFGPIIEALRTLPDELSLARVDELAGTGRADLARLLPGLRHPSERHCRQAPIFLAPAVCSNSSCCSSTGWLSWRPWCS